MKQAIGLLIVIVCCAACLRAENRHAFYLEPDGSATWAVTEEDVRSDKQDRADRDSEEGEYLRRARRGDTEIANALREVGASWVETAIVRELPPYTVRTEARFDSAASMLERFLREIGFEAESDLRFEGDRTTLSFRFWESATGDGEVAGEDGSAGCLVEPVEQYRFVLTDGKFVEASGFRFEEGDTVAVMLDLDDVEVETEPESAYYSLSWSSGR